MLKRIKKVQILATIAFISVLLTAAVNSAPKLSLPEDGFDFGFVPQNAKVSHEFWLHSSGSDTLFIKNVVPGCSCTKTPLEKNLLAGGDSTRLEVIFSTKTYVNSVYKKPKIITNEETAETYLIFHANVVTRPDSTFPVILRPYKLDMSQFNEKVIDKAAFRIKNVSNEDRKISLISSFSEYFKIELPESIKAGETIEAIVTINPDALDKEFEKSITFQLDDEDSSRFTIPVKRDIKKIL